ncbi:MAG: NIPSNAP family protein [Microscillaceae bacterium]|nr:NIPSNAP family protein [Microscillaceae bacterium]
MKRRKFVQATALASTLPLAALAGQQNLLADKELYELRTYEIKFGGNQNMLVEYLKNVYQPALKRLGVNHFMLFNEYGNDNPAKIWLLISYPNATVYLQAQNLQNDSVFSSQSADYNALPADKPIYTRFRSSLLLAFDGMPQLTKPQDGSSLYELRIYEGYSEDAVRRKVLMFNKEEIPLFWKTKLYPVFFGEMMVGPYCPSLVYMLNFKDMEERDANWKVFVNHPEWKVMSAKPEYANSVSNIIRIFLKPM